MWVDLAIIAAGALPILLYRDLRTARAVGFVAALGAIGLLASALPPLAQFIVKSGAVWSYVIVYLCFQHLLAGRSAAEARINGALRCIARDADELAHAGSTDKANADAGRASIFGRIRALQPPNPAWARVVELMDSYCRRRLGQPHDAATSGVEPTLAAPAAQLEQIARDLTSAWEHALHPETRPRD